MNVILPEKEKVSKKTIIIYTAAILACIIAILVVILAQYYGVEKLDNMVKTGSMEISDSEKDIQTLKIEFNNMLNNTLENKNEDIEVKKLENDKDIIFTDYQKKENKENSYDLDLNIPKINIDSEIIKKYNDEIAETFIKKAEDIIKIQNMNSIYTVQYSATIEENILSLVIYSNLKDGNNAQRVIVLTYNYDLIENKEIEIEEIIKNRELDKGEIESKVKENIKIEQNKANDLKSLGYSIYERDSESDIYKLKNTKEFFIKDGRIYLIYAYGNENITSEMDIVVI